MANTDSPPSATQMPRRPTKGWWFGLAMLIVVILVSLFVVGTNEHLGQKVYAQAAGHKIYKKDLEKLEIVGGERTDVTDHQAATVLAEKYLLEAMAKQQNVTISQADITAAYGSGFGSKKAIDPYGYQNLLNDLYKTKMANYNQGVYSGKLLVANFSRYVAYQSALLPEQKAHNPKLGDPAAIAADKKYAQDFITNLYNQVKDKKMTFDQAIQAEHSDPVVGEAAYPTQQHSGPFSGPLEQAGLLVAHSIRDKITAMKPGQLSQPFVVRVSNSDSDHNSTAESYFLVVEMDKVSGSGSNLPFDQVLAQAKQKMGYKVNV